MSVKDKVQQSAKQSKDSSNLNATHQVAIQLVEVNMKISLERVQFIYLNY